MVDDTSEKNPRESLKKIDEELKKIGEQTKQNLEQLNNYSLESPQDEGDYSSKILSIVQEQKKINRNITQNINYLSQKIQIIQDSIIGDPGNLGQVGTILDRLNQLERNVIPDPSRWPSLPILTAKPITTQEENISHTLLALLYGMVDYAKVNSNYKQIKFPLKSNLGDSHLRFERRHHNMKFLYGNAIGIVDSEFLQSVLLISNSLYFGLILCDNLELGSDTNIKIIKHRKSFDELEKIYSKTVDIIFDKCPFEVKPDTKEFFLTLPFPGYYKDDEDE